ncbi:MAG: polyprenyl synthetase family protein [Myxococcota bacterium]
MDPELREWLGPQLARVEAALDAALGRCWPEPLAEAMGYAILGGGKRVRPALVLTAFDALRPGADVAPALAPAAAVELVHGYSLVHDDLPAMDDDDLRRGVPTVHKQYGEAAAILTGDALLTEAFSVLAEAPGLPPETRIALVRILAEAAGGRGMVAGQALDVGMAGPITDLETLTRLHAGKTGALLTASAAMGAVAAGAAPAERAALEAYGRAVGLAFQLADDVLDADEAADPDGPPSFVRLLGLDETVRRARALAREAEAAVAGLPHPGRLVALARFVVERQG